MKSKLLNPPLAIATLIFGLIITAFGGDAPLAYFPFDGDDQPIPKNSVKVKTFKTPRYVEGKIGKAISLTDNVHLRIKLPEVFNKGEFSIAFWMKPLWHQGDGLPHPIFEFESAPDTYDKVGWSPTQILFSKGWSETISANGFWGVAEVPHLFLQPNVWTHIVFTYDAKNKCFGTYFNGYGRNRADKGDKLMGHDVLWLGSRVKGKGCADVIIDELKLYDRVLDPKEIPAIAVETLDSVPDFRQVGQKCDPANMIETPHLKWAKPLARGPLKVVFVGEASRSREFIELVQRLEVIPTFITSPVIDEHSLLTPKHTKDVSEKLEKILKNTPPDCVVLGAYGWNLLDKSTRDSLLEFVRNGGGLLLSSPQCVNTTGTNKSLGHGKVIGWRTTKEGKDIEKLVNQPDKKDTTFLVDNIPWNEISMFSPYLANQPPSSLFRCGTLGKGRLLVYDINTGGVTSLASLCPNMSYIATDFNRFDYDYAMGAAAKAVLWTAGRDAEVVVENVEFASERRFFRIPVVGLQGVWRVRIENRTNANVAGKINLTIRDRGPVAPTVISRDINLTPGENVIEFPVVLDRLGKNFADVRILLDGKIADWGTGIINVDSGNPKIMSVGLDKRYYRPSTTPHVTATVNLRDGKGLVGVPGIIYWDLYDSYDRLVAKGEKRFTYNDEDRVSVDVGFTLPALTNKNLVYKLLLRTHDGKQVSDVKTVTIRNRIADNDDFQFYAWSGKMCPPLALALGLARDKYGLDAACVDVGFHVVDEKLEQGLKGMNDLNLRPWIYATHLGHGGKNQFGERLPDWADQLWLKDQGTRLEKITETAKAHSPLFISLGDEVKSGNRKIQPSGQEQDRFRSYLYNKYKTIKKVNETLKTNYKNWAEVEVPSSAVMISKDVNPRLMFEVLDFRDQLFSDLIGYCAEATLNVDSKSKTGIEGIFSLEHPTGYMDYADVASKSTFMGLYGGNGLDANMTRCFQKSGDLLGCWYNYELYDKNYSLYGPWAAMMDGVNAFGWFTTFDGSWYSIFNPDFSPTYNFKHTFSELKPILEGIGMLTMALERQNHGIYILFNFHNLKRSTLGYLSMKQTTTMLNDAGIPYDFIDVRQVDQQALQDKKVKILFLIGQNIMPQNVATNIEKFVKRGGVVVSDIVPGNSNGMEKFNPPLLNELFVGANEIREDIPLSSDDTAAITKKHTKKLDRGKTLLLGSYLTSYTRTRFRPEGQRLRQMLEDFMVENGVSTRFQITTSDKKLRPTIMVEYADGANRYLAIRRDYQALDQAPYAFTLSYPAKHHIYDARAGRYLGFSGEVKKELEVAKGALISFLNYKVESLRLEGLPQTCQRGDRLILRPTLDFDGQTPGKGVFRVDVLDPTGKPVHPLCGNYHSLGGVCEFELVLGHNDPVGTWTIKVKDVATGITSTKSFELSGGVLGK